MTEDAVGGEAGRGSVVMPGTVVEPWGKVVAVGTGVLPGGYCPKPGDTGERYYALMAADGSMSYMPADAVEKRATDPTPEGEPT